MPDRIPMRLLEPKLSYIISMGYFSGMCILALWMCRRNFTRLRIFACTLTFFGLSIAIMGYMRAMRWASPNWFWVWNFAGELLAVAGLTIAIVSVGNGFYPMSRNRSVYWAMAMGIICLYVTCAVINIGYYIATKIVPRHIPYDEVMGLRDKIVSVGLVSSMDEILQQRLDECKRGRIDTCEVPATGYHTWRQLSYLEREMFVRPATWAYMTHQILMLCTCLWVVIYLFIPLVRNHRNGAVGRSVDGDSMAVGVWYLTTLMSLATVYGALNIYYLHNFELIYHESVQALDLGVRCTIGPIFFIPAPRCLIEFYRRHFSAMAKSGSNQESRRGGGHGSSIATSPRFEGQGSFLGPNFEIRPTASFGYGGEPEITQPQQAHCQLQPIRGSFDILYPNGGGTSGDHKEAHSEPSSPLKRMYGSLKLFQSRNRGLSNESGREFNRDYPGEIEVEEMGRGRRGASENGVGHASNAKEQQQKQQQQQQQRSGKERPESTQRLTENLHDLETASGQYYAPTNYPVHSDVDPLNVTAHTPVMGLRAPPPHHDLSHAKHHHHRPPQEDWRAATTGVEGSYQDRCDSNTPTGWEAGCSGDGDSQAEWRQQQHRLSLDLLQGGRGSQERGRRLHRGSQDSSRASFPRYLHRRSYTYSQLEEKYLRRTPSGSARLSGDPLQDNGNNAATSALGDGEKSTTGESISDMVQQRTAGGSSLCRESSEVARPSNPRDGDYTMDIAGRDSYIEVPRQGYGGFTSRDRASRLSLDSSRSRGHNHSPSFLDELETNTPEFLPELQESLVSHAVDPTYWTRAPSTASRLKSDKKSSSSLGGQQDSTLTDPQQKRRSSPASKVSPDSGIMADYSSSKSPKLQHKTSRQLLGGGKKKEQQPKEKETSADKKPSGAKSGNASRWWPGHRKEASTGTVHTMFSNDSDPLSTSTTATTTNTATTSTTATLSGNVIAGYNNPASAGARTTSSVASGLHIKPRAASKPPEALALESSTGISSPLHGKEGAPIEELTKVSLQCPRVAAEAARRAEESLWAQYDYPDPYFDESTYRKFLKAKSGSYPIEDLSSLPSPPSSPPMPSDARTSIQLHTERLESRGIKSSLEMTVSSPNIGTPGPPKPDDSTIIAPATVTASNNNIMPSSPSPASGKTSFGSFLSRTASGSKRLVPPKLKGRGLRSKSDAPLSAQGGGEGTNGVGGRGRTSTDAATNKPLKPQTALPITTTRPNPPPPEEDPSLMQYSSMMMASLSPPPRQNWTRNKALLSASSGAVDHETSQSNGSQSSGSKGAGKSSILSVNTVVANAAGRASQDQVGGSGSGGGSASSLSSFSPTHTATNVSSSLTSAGSGSVPSTPGSPPLSPYSGSGGRRSESSDTSTSPRVGPRSLISSMANMDSRRQYQLHHNNNNNGTKSLGSAGGSATNKSSLSTSPSRPTDNLAQAYYYNKRAAQAAAAAAAGSSSNSGSPYVSQELPTVTEGVVVANTTTATTTTTTTTAAPSPLISTAEIARTGYSYYGTNNSSHSGSEANTPRRGSPSPDPSHYHHPHGEMPTMVAAGGSTITKKTSRDFDTLGIGRPISPPLHYHHDHSPLSSSPSIGPKNEARSSVVGARPLSPPMTASSPSLSSDPGSSSSPLSSPLLQPPQPAYVSSSSSSAPAGRTSSLTNSFRQMADDAWTQAMVARAQSSATSRS